MWENWEKTKISNTEKIYSFLVTLKGEPKIVIELTAMLLQTQDIPPNWKVLITAFHPSSGEYIDFEDTFLSLEEAEKKAWEEAQEAIKVRKS